MRYSHLIIAILSGLAGLSFVLDYYDHIHHMYLVYIPLVAIIGAVLALQGDIDYYFAIRTKQKIAPKEQQFLSTRWYLYPLLPESLHETFYHETYLQYIGNQYKQSGSGATPSPDIRLLCAATSAFIGLLLDDLRKELTYVFYNHPFHSPEQPFLHIEEWHATDKTFIFSVDHLRSGIIDPIEHLDILLYTHLAAKLPADKYHHIVETWINHSHRIYTDYLMKGQPRIHWKSLYITRRLAMKDVTSWMELKELYTSLLA